MKLGPELEKKIDTFRETFNTLIESFKVSMTPKIRIILVALFCNRKQSSLGIYSEQSGESIHYDFNTTACSRFKVSPNNPRFYTCLLKALASYNGKHLMAIGEKDIDVLAGMMKEISNDDDPIDKRSQY